MNTRYLLLSAAIAGVLTALLSAIPLISALNCLLCAWLWLGGIFAVWLYRNQTGDIITTNSGLIIGVVTGLVGAVVATILNLAVGMVAAPVPPETMRQLEEVMGESAQLLTNPATSAAISLISNLILYPLFGAIGGLIGAALFKSKPAA